MVILFLLLAIISLAGVRYSCFHSDYMSIASTNAIKGIFTVFILYGHMAGYLSIPDLPMNIPFLSIQNYMMQLIVVMFLFYSGYGIMHSLRHKPHYSDSFFRKRILKVLLHFDIAVILFLTLQTILGAQYGWFEYATCWFAWLSIGNSNWFIFDILALYCFVWCALKMKLLAPGRIGGGICLVVLLCAILWFALNSLKSGLYWWYDTFITFPLGMIYAIMKNKIDGFLKSSLVYFTTLFLLLFAFITWHCFYGVDPYGVCACLFALLIVVFSMRIRLDNPILQWLGTYSFAIYIMQRWPMLLFLYFKMDDNILLFVLLSIPSALFVAWLYQKVLNRVDKVIFS